MRLPHATVALFLATACSSGGPPDAGTSQERYSYPGCPDASFGCPHDGTFSCALDSIRDKYRTCADAGDCVRPPVGNCVGWGDCTSVAVAAASLQAYSAETSTETTRYCGPFPSSGCRESPSCAASYSLGKVTCLNGQCVGLLNDAGP